MSQEKVLKTLQDLGLTSLDSKIYIYLAKKGPQKGNAISKALKVQKQQLYRNLKKLQSKAIVSATLEHPAKFSAVPFEKVLDLFIKAKLQEAQTIQTEKTRLLSSWQAMQAAETPDASARFMVIKGRNIIYSRIKQMINATKTQLSIISTISGLARADQFGLLDTGFKHPLRSEVQFRFLTHLSKENLGTMQTLLKETPKADLRFEIRTPNIGSSLFPRMVIRDQEEVVFFINPKVDAALPEQDDLCLWTNCKSLIYSFLAMFEELWRNSTDIERKIVEIETGKPTPKTFVMSEAEAIKKKYHEVMQSVREEIMLLTSSEGLIEAYRDMPKFRNWTKRGISIKIMAPIVKENWEAMKQLSKICAVKHTPINYLETTIIDRKHLFQFKTPVPDREDFESASRFDDAYYTNDLEWVGRIKTTLDDIWRSAQVPSSVTLELIGGPFGYPIFPLPKDYLMAKMNVKAIDLKPPGLLTEKEVLNKIIHGRRMICKNPAMDPSRAYGSLALGVIHPPARFNLPDMMIEIRKVEKQSSFGEENIITVYLWLETPTGHAFVPVALVGDNPKAEPLRRMMSAGTPAGQNIQFYNKDKLQVSLHGKTLFAGWTVPIPLHPHPYILPPACVLFEGHGNVRTTGYTIILPSGFGYEAYDNAFDAFVTFIHPASKYSGPSTDGILIRDQIATITPP
jgi:sugar-specific transcriptional regulator TrmB